MARIGIRRFERMYSATFDDVLRYCLRRTDREAALDAVAEVFTIAWRRRDRIEGKDPLPWLYGIARRVLSNQWRSRARRNRLTTRLAAVESHSGPDPEAEAVRGEETRELLEALERLRTPEQEIIRLAGWEDLDRHQIGVVLGCSTNAVTKRLNRALDHLATELGTRRVAGTRFFRREGRSA